MNLVHFRRAVLTLVCVAAASAASAQIPLQAWVHDAVLRSVSLSPDGRYIAAVSPPQVDAVPQIAVWDANDLSKPPVRTDLTAADGSRWKPQGVFWLNNDTFFATGAQTFDLSVGARLIKTFRSATFIGKLTADRGLKVTNPFGTGSTIEDLVSGQRLLMRMPKDDSKVLVAARNFEGAENVYELSLKNYSSRRVFRGAAGSNALADLDGEIRARSKFEGDGETARIETEVRRKGSSAWTQITPFFARDRQGLQPLGFAKDPDILYVTDNKDREFAVLREYSVSTGNLSEPIFGHPKYDAIDTVIGTTKKKYGELLGFSYNSPWPSIYWIDPDRLGLEAALKKALPGKQIALQQFSDDETRAIVLANATNDPGTIYLYDAAKGLTMLGRPYPLLDPEKLAETRFVTYKARDGLEIPAFLTIPKRGTKPFPAVVMPHGGPWARDNLSYDYSQWRQFLADRGYVVLQPQYRGSEGWGQKLWRAGDREWGQKMQDDKDDGAKWLVDQGLVDKDRIALYGFSYGGYAAMASIVRPNPPWQCAIAGAGLAELRTFDKFTFESRFGREFQNPTIAGLSPIDHVKDASIPIMIFHGDRDQTVPIDQSERYFQALKQAGKNVTYTEIDDYGHGPSLATAKQAQVLEILENYLARDCGPGGL